MPSCLAAAPRNVDAINTPIFATDSARLRSFWVHEMRTEDLSKTFLSRLTTHLLSTER